MGKQLKQRATLIAEILAQRELGLSFKTISENLHVPISTAKRWASRAAEMKLTSTEAYQTAPDVLCEMFRRGSSYKRRILHIPNWSEIIASHSGRYGKSVSVLYEEYIKNAPPNTSVMSRTLFYKEMSEQAKKLGPNMHIVSIANSYLPGNVAQIDYSGDGCEIWRKDGTTWKANIFVGVLPYSGYIFCYATQSQKRGDWLQAIDKMYAFFGGVTKELWLDNSTSLVDEASKDNPKLNPEFVSFCQHFAVVGYPVAPGKPRHKAMVENAVQQCQNKILKSLVKMKFFSLEELNKAIQFELEALNNRPLSKSPSETRALRFQREKRALRPLPALPYVDVSGALRFNRKVLPNGQVRIQNCRYSVPRQYIGETICVFTYPTQRLVRMFTMDGEPIRDTELRKPEDRDEPTPKEHLPEYGQLLVSTRKELLDKVKEEYGPFAFALAEIFARPQNSWANRHLIALLEKARGFEKDVFEEICKEVVNENRLARHFEKFSRLCRETTLNLRRQRKLNVPAVAITKAPAEDIRGADYFRRLIERKGGQSNGDNQ